MHEAAYWFVLFLTLEIPKIPTPVFKRGVSSLEINTILMLDDQIDGIKARLFTCWEALVSREYPVDPRRYSLIESDISNFLLDFRSFVAKVRPDEETLEESTSCQSVSEDQYLVERIDCDWNNSLLMPLALADASEQVWEFTMEEEEWHSQLSRDERIERRRRALSEQDLAQKRAIDQFSLIRELKGKIKT